MVFDACQPLGHLELGDLLRRDVAAGGGVVDDDAADAAQRAARVLGGGGCRKLAAQVGHDRLCDSTRAQLVDLHLQPADFRVQRLDLTARRSGLGCLAVEAGDGACKLVRLPGQPVDLLYGGQQGVVLRLDAVVAGLQRGDIRPDLLLPLVAGGQRLAEVGDDAVLAFDPPAVVADARVAIEDQRADLLGAAVVPAVDFLVGLAHPARVAIGPGVVALVGLGEVDR